MKIGFDAKRFFNNKTGLGSYSRNLINSMIKEYPQHKYYLYTPDQPPVEHINKYLDISNVKIRYPKKSYNQYWRTRGILKDLVKDKIDIYHGLSNELPFGIHKTRIKTVVTIHDLLFKKFPDDYSLIDRMIFDWKSKYACTKADRVISISAATQEDLLKHYEISPPKISTIYQDISPHFLDDLNTSDAKSILKSLQIDFEFLLFIGNNKGRKNLKTVLQSLRSSKTKRHIILVLPSQELSLEHSKYIRKYGIEPFVHILSNLSIKQMKVLYKFTSMLLYPSLGEGWGLPVEEALVFNKFVIVPKIKPFTEVPSENKVFLKDPLDPNELVEKIEYVACLNNNNLASRNQTPRASMRYIHTYQNLLFEK